MIDEVKCINCKACVRICPAINKIKHPQNDYQKECYAAWSNDNLRHFESASGGIASELARQFILNGGFVAGVIFNKSTKLAQHICTDNVDDLKEMAKSKYIQSDKTGLWLEIDRRLTDKKKCLFFGIPCEVYAFKRFMENYIEGNVEYYCVDLLCHGGASPLCFTQHLKNLPNAAAVNKVTFRGGKFDCHFAAYHDDTLLYLNGQYHDAYFSEFMRHSIFQPKCYVCPFANIDRTGDITLGDFWGLLPTVEKESKIRGVNMVFVNNVKGNALMNLISGYVTLKPRPIDEAAAGNDTLREPTDKPLDYNEFWQKIYQKGFPYAANQKFILMTVDLKDGQPASEVWKRLGNRVAAVIFIDEDLHGKALTNPKGNPTPIISLEYYKAECPKSEIVIATRNLEKAVQKLNQNNISNYSIAQEIFI